MRLFAVPFFAAIFLSGCMAQPPASQPQPRPERYEDQTTFRTGIEPPADTGGFTTARPLTVRVVPGTASLPPRTDTMAYVPNALDSLALEKLLAALRRSGVFETVVSTQSDRQLSRPFYSLEVVLNPQVSLPPGATEPPPVSIRIGSKVVRARTAMLALDTDASLFAFKERGDDLLLADDYVVDGTSRGMPGQESERISAAWNGALDIAVAHIVNAVVNTVSKDPQG